jgi:hypothetical protein
VGGGQHGVLLACRSSCVQPTDTLRLPACSDTLCRPPRCREPALTTRTSSFSGCLDYIWLSKLHWQVAGTLQMPYAEPRGPPGPPEGVTTLGTCPNEQQPSDHLAVGCDAVLLPREGAGNAAMAAAAADALT